MKCGCNPEWTDTCPACRPDLAAARVTEYLRQRKSMPGFDRGEIGSVHSDMDAAPAVLFTADLAVLARAALALLGQPEQP